MVMGGTKGELRLGEGDLEKVGELGKAIGHHRKPGQFMEPAQILDPDPGLFGKFPSGRLRG
jgi:hypothetical protein